MVNNRGEFGMKGRVWGGFLSKVDAKFMSKKIDMKLFCKLLRKYAKMAKKCNNHSFRILS